MSSTDEPVRPTLRVIRGDATDEEITALLVVVAARAAATGPGPSRPERPVSAWNNRAATLRHPQHPGPGAWRASAWLR
jgi:hypothetical protein